MLDLVYGCPADGRHSLTRGFASRLRRIRCGSSFVSQKNVYRPEGSDKGNGRQQRPTLSTDMSGQFY
uniref:Uncharacterized protein n=1 Tax=Steinernema glaseri TaxID=37863 RepID=A0A1I7YQS5_9BILA